MQHEKNRTLSFGRKKIAVKLRVDNNRPAPGVVHPRPPAAFMEPGGGGNPVLPPAAFLGPGGGGSPVLEPADFVAPGDGENPVLEPAPGAHYGVLGYALTPADAWGYPALLAGNQVLAEPPLGYPIRDEAAFVANPLGGGGVDLPPEMAWGFEDPQGAANPHDDRGLQAQDAQEPVGDGQDANPPQQPGPPAM